MVSRFKECDRCKLANDVLNQYAETTEGIVLTYLMDCDSIWKAEQDRVRVPSCDPDKKHELPSLTFF